MGRREWPTAERRLAPWLTDAPSPGSPWQQHPLPAFPPCYACAYGDDVYGLWYEFEFKGVRQRMRWIPPGQFKMGSPGTEPGRESNETQHRISLSQGFWLADTACTQALWQAVTGDNPSKYKKSETNPVEKVSWNDIQHTFLPAINERFPLLPLQLPTEAQWEYACRAGSTTAFWWGETLSPEQAHYYYYSMPYNGGTKTDESTGTVAVKSFTPNPWGLYQMHGNVWEWCNDWFGEYAGSEASDPQGASVGSQRVLRGGCWFSFGRWLRSAQRGDGRPDFRDGIVGGNSGFRFSQVP